MDSTAIIPVSHENENSLNNINNSNDFTVDKINLDTLSLYVDDVCSYIAGFVVKTLETRINCKSCKMQLQYDYHESHLSIIKDRGSLKKASKDVISICKISENIFRQHHTSSIIKTKNNFPLIINKVKNVLHTKFNIFEKMECVSIDPSTLLDGIQQFDTHRNILIENVIENISK